MIIYIKICLKGLSLVLICKVQKKCAVSRKQLEEQVWGGKELKQPW